MEQRAESTCMCTHVFTYTCIGSMRFPLQDRLKPKLDFACCNGMHAFSALMSTLSNTMKFIDMCNMQPNAAAALTTPKLAHAS